MTAASSRYDAVPYESFPFPHTHPRQLRALARLFGLSPPPLARARILELGCASGGNIVPIALDEPDSEIVGVDLSGRQIAAGRRTVDALALRNIALKAMSIMDIDEGLGTFDYIICHGVFAWVAPEVQRKILAVCKANLRPDGIAFVSYNTLPGWNMVRSVREMMLYHTRFYADPAVKAKQARAVLDFVAQATGEQKTIVADIVRAEADLLKGQPDWYLLHDHLEEANNPVYFHQFMAMAGAAGLAYLGDSSLASMYTGNLPDDIARQLNAANDIVRTEQYKDFLSNRRFRNTLLCHAGARIDRRLAPGLLESLLLAGTLVPQSPQDIDLASDQPVVFTGPVSFTVANRVLTALLLDLSQRGGRPVGLDDLAAAASARLDNVDAATARKVMLDHGLQLLLAGGLHLLCDAYHEVAAASVRPVVSPLVRHQAAHQPWVTTQRHAALSVDPVQRAILRLLDGTHDHAAIAQSILARVKSREFGVSRDGRELTTPAEMADEVAHTVAAHLDFFARMALLVA